MSQRPPVLVLGSGLTPLGALRCLARKDVAVKLPVRQPDFVRASRWYRDPHLPRLDEDVDLAGYLAALPLERAVLLPCSDGWVERVAALPDDLAPRFPASVPSPDAVAVLVDKGRFARHLAAAGLPHPATRPLGEGEDPAALLDDHGSRFLKPRNSQAFQRRFGRKGVMLDAGISSAMLSHLREAGPQLLVQEYVPGPASNHYFVDGFVDRAGEIRGVMVRRRLRMYPPDFGNSTYMVSVPVERAGPAVDTVCELLSGLGYRGVFSAEFKKDARDGTFRLLEVNARPWIYVEFAARCGTDVCAMAYRDALGCRVRGVERYETGRTLVRPYYDFWACVDLWRKGELSPVPALRSWAGADVPTFALDDPAPGLRSSAGWIGGVLRRRMPGAAGKERA